MPAITRILVPTDFSETADAALIYAKRYAEQFGASLHLVYTFEDPFARAAFAYEAYSTVPATLRDQLLREAHEHLNERLTADEKNRFTAVTEVAFGPPSPAIVEYADEHGIDLIVMGTHGRGGVAHLLLGSVAERVVRTASCPVLTIRERPNRAVKRILVPTDFSATSDRAFDYALELAAGFGADVQLLHVLHDPFVAEEMAVEAYLAEAPAMRTALLDDAVARLNHRSATSRPGVAVGSEVLFGKDAKTIAEYATARNADLIVMGTHGRTGVAHLLLGSVAERLVRTAPCPVLTVRAVSAATARAELVYQVDHLPA